MEWEQALAIIGSNVAFFLSILGLLLWFRSESREDWKLAREDWKHLDEKVDANHRETLCIINSIQLEIKDFHGRLCSIEERRK